MTVRSRPVASLLAHWQRLLATLAVAALLISVGRPIVPGFLFLHRSNLLASAQRHGVAADALAAILYNEMLGQEERFLSSIIPGDQLFARWLREGLLGWHFMTLKQAQWAIKGGLALLGANTTLGPTGIRVSVGREIRHEATVAGGVYRPRGLAERPSLVLDLALPATAIEYLAANLERGRQRALVEQVSDWTAIARWHNTGLTSDRPDVPRRLWVKGSRYIARVVAFVPYVTAIIAPLDQGATHANEPGKITVESNPIGIVRRRSSESRYLAGVQ